MEQDRVLGTAAPVRHLSWAAGQLEAAVLAQLAAQLGDPNSRRPPATLIHTWRPLILCSRGDQPSTQAVLTILTQLHCSTIPILFSPQVGLCILQLGFYPSILRSGFLQYRWATSQNNTDKCWYEGGW